jgi:hypothetical protein
MQICGLGRYSCGKTGCKPPAIAEVLRVSFDYKREGRLRSLVNPFVRAAGNENQAEQPPYPYE